MKRFCALVAVLVLVLAAVPSVAAYGEHWIDSVPTPTDAAYSFCVVGDTQVLCDESPENFKKIYDWILANYKSKKMKAVIGMGDITEHKTDIEEWTLAYDQISRLFGKLPVYLARGNHDDAQSFNSTFYELNEDVDGAFEPGDLCNAYRYLTVGETHYLILTLDYGPSNDVLDWANEVARTHPGYNIIVNTHGYLNNGGVLAPKGDPDVYGSGMAYHGAQNGGVEIWERFASQHKNVVMVLCGHIGENGVEHSFRMGKNKNPVLEMLINPQNIDDQHKHTGMVAMLYFNADGSKVTVQNYSTVEGKFYGAPFSASVNKVKHVHKALDDTLESDAKEHWKLCPCGEKVNVEAHRYISGKCACGALQASSGSTVKPATTTKAGTTTATTTVPSTAVVGTPEPVVEGEPFPWWIVALIGGGVLIIAGMAVAIVLILKKK